MPVIQPAQVHTCQHGERDDGDEEEQVGRQAARVAGRVSLAVQQRADYVAETLAKEDCCVVALALCVAGGVLCGP